ncbi:hypothetical protein H4219_003763 [Mycoemilia scoparia]|uniref:DH domain-containing protein n=1 Tax=Mycoemilia scoparia TaxID=417184 RepID=A0A9W7ZTS2_9FUNG|nr:hypothetical protein H4219_003763 [Mycoemilia scoparia]
MATEKGLARHPPQLTLATGVKNAAGISWGPDTNRTTATTNTTTAANGGVGRQKRAMSSDFVRGNSVSNSTEATLVPGKGLYRGRKSESSSYSRPSRSSISRNQKNPTSPKERGFRLQPRSPEDDYGPGDNPITKSIELTGKATVDSFRKSKGCIPYDTEVVRAKKSSLPSIPVSFFFGHPYIQVLDLSHNNITVLPEAVARLDQLRRLHLQHNQLRELPASLTTLRNLELLTVSDNNLVTLDSSIGQLERLEILDISNNLLTTIPTSLGFLVHTLSIFLVDGNPFDKYMVEVLKPIFTKPYKREGSFFGLTLRRKSSPLPMRGASFQPAKNNETSNPPKSAGVVSDPVAAKLGGKGGVKGKLSGLFWRRSKPKGISGNNESTSSITNDGLGTTPTIQEIPENGRASDRMDLPDEARDSVELQKNDSIKRNYNSRDIYSVEKLGYLDLRSSVLDKAFTPEQLLVLGNIESAPSSPKTNAGIPEDSKCGGNGLDKVPMLNENVSANGEDDESSGDDVDGGDGVNAGSSEDTISSCVVEPKSPEVNDRITFVGDNDAAKGDSHDEIIEISNGSSAQRPNNPNGNSNDGKIKTTVAKGPNTSSVYSNGVKSRMSITSGASSTKFSSDTSKSGGKRRARNSNLPLPPAQQSPQLATALYTLHDMWDVDPKNSEHDQVKLLTGYIVARYMEDKPQDISEHTQKFKSRPEERDQAVLEVIVSEFTYIGIMRDLITCYLIPMREQHVLSEKELNVLFGNLETIYAFHINHLHPALLECLESAGIDSDVKNYNIKLRDGAKEGSAQIGHVFVKFAPIFKLYALYSTNYKKAIEVFSEIETRRSWSNFIKWQRKNKPLSNRTTDFKDKLVKPIQRIPNYLLYIRRVLSLTPPDHPDHDNLRQALLEITKQGSIVNSKQGLAEERQELYKLQHKIKGSQVIPLISPYRKFLRIAKFRLHLYIEPVDVPNVAPLTRNYNVTRNFRKSSMDGSRMSISNDLVEQPQQETVLPKVRRYGPDIVYTYYLFNDLIVECTCVMDNELTFNRAYRLTNRILAAVVTPNKCLRVVHESGIIYLQGPTNGDIYLTNIVIRMERVAKLSGHDSYVTGLDLREDGGDRLLASLSDDTDPTLKLWDLNQNKQISSINGLGKEATSVKFSKCGNDVLVASNNKIFRFDLRKISSSESSSNTAKDQSLQIYEFSGSTIESIDVNTNSHLGLINDDGEVHVIDLKTTKKYTMDTSDIHGNIGSKVKFIDNKPDKIQDSIALPNYGTIKIAA